MKKHIAFSVATLMILPLFNFGAYAREPHLDTVSVIGKQKDSPVSDLAGSVDFISQEELTHKHVVVV